MCCKIRLKDKHNSLDFTDHVYFVHPSTDILVDISTNTRPMYWLTYRPSVDWCPSTYWPTLGWYYDRDMSVNVLTNVSTEISAEWWSTYRPTIGRYLSRYSGRHSVDMLTTDCWQNIGRLSVVYRSKASTVSVRCISYTHFILFWSTSNISEGFMFGLHVPHIQPLSSKTLMWNTAKHKIQLTGKRIRSKKQAWVYLAVGLQNNLQVKLCLRCKLQSLMHK